MSFRDKCAALFDIEHPLGRGVGFAVQSLILTSLITYAISTLPGISKPWEETLDTIEMLLLGIFTMEYGLRLYSAPHRLRFAGSFFGLVDLLAIAPFYFGIGTSALSLRVLRMVRLVRLLKLARYSQAVERLAKAVRETAGELVMFLLISLAFIYIAAVGIYHFEHEAQPEIFSSVIHSLWWAVATLTTVGYGDAYPVTTGGKIFTSLVVMVGIGIVAVPSGLLAAALTRNRNEDSGAD